MKSNEKLKDNLWSAIRTLLFWGADIEKDYNAGADKSYEEFSARLDGAARDRIDWLYKIVIDSMTEEESAGVKVVEVEKLKAAIKALDPYMQGGETQVEVRKLIDSLAVEREPEPESLVKAREAYEKWNNSDGDCETDRSFARRGYLLLVRYKDELEALKARIG